ncbi:hypothetical protein D3C77_412620 [compost metagenome]
MARFSVSACGGNNCGITCAASALAFLASAANRNATPSSAAAACNAGSAISDSLASRHARAGSAICALANASRTVVANCAETAVTATMTQRG